MAQKLAFKCGGFPLLAALLLFPQIVETIYSPALLDIGRAFRVTPQIAAQTLSCYFIAFAAGVLVWGRLCDRIGRRPAMLCGLAVYGLASLAALLATTFPALLAARVLAAFGAAVGSIVTQTILRDRLQGAALAGAYSMMGVILALSPAIGLMSGSVLTQVFGYRGVFSSLFVLAVALLLWSAVSLKETRPASSPPPLMQTAVRMVADRRIWLAAILIAAFNISLFSYYQLAPFLVERLRFAPATLVWGGVLLAAGSITGSRVNAFLLRRGADRSRLLLIGIGLNLIGAATVIALQDQWLFVLGMLLVAMSFAMVIPLVLGSALAAYTDCRGSAGALLGMGYYVLIGTGLVIAGLGQDLGPTLALCALASLAAAALYAPFLTDERSTGRAPVFPVPGFSNPHR